MEDLDRDEDETSYGMEDRGDERTFRVNFSIDGAGKLRETVKDKLKEFMGDYTDDTLVEYVIVLLRNGRHKEEARNELNVFLGDDTDSFVTWLWDHLSLNLHLYVQSRESYIDETPKTKPTLEEQAERDDSQLLDSEREQSTRESRSRRNREWKGLLRDVAEPPPLRSSEIDIFHPVEKNHQKLGRVKRSRSPRPSIQNKRNRQFERQEMKRPVPLHSVINAPRTITDAPRRLLQFAVRDAVGTSLRSSSSKTDPTLKRLRSVVSTSTEDSSLNYQPQQIRSVARMPGSIAIRAAAAAAEDTKLRGFGNVFDRLSHDMHIAEMTNQGLDCKTAMIEDVGYEDFDKMDGIHSDYLQRDEVIEDFDKMDGIHSDYLQRDEVIEDFTGNTSILERDTGNAYDSASDNDGYDGIEVAGSRAADAYQCGSSYGNKDDESLMVQYSVAKDTDGLLRRTWVRDQDPPPAAANTSRKIVNISVNVNTWKPPHYQEPQEVTEAENVKAVQESEGAAAKLGVRVMKERTTNTTVKQYEKPGRDMHKESQAALPSTPGSYSTVRPSDDADCRTIFVNNVHFAATKDTLFRHFNKFGEVLKVVVVTDATTGQPKGSAYIEFMRKESAELALSLNGTSFMSRILKVVRKSSAHQEVAPVMSWPRAARASPYPARLTRVPFPRGQAAFRGRLPIKTGARSMQWKRGATATSAVEGSANVQNGGASLSTSNVPSPSPRSLTYVRTEGKPVGNVGSA